MLIVLSYVWMNLLWISRGNLVVYFFCWWWFWSINTFFPPSSVCNIGLYQN